MSIYQPELARVTRAFSPTGFDRLLEIKLPGGRALGHQPGQFVELSSLGIGEAPISLCSAPSASSFEVCIRDMGGVTSHFQQLETGDSVGVRGPYGKGFPLEAMAGKNCLIVAGGIGLAPLRSLLQSIVAARDRYGRLIVMYGAREPGELLFTEDLASWAEDPRNEVLVTVDRATGGWSGHVGVVTTLFSEVELGPPRALATAVVGPPVMYRFVLAELASRFVPDDQIFISLERRMRCGVGKCGHCKVDGKEVCIHGPVFTGAEVKGFHETL